MLVHVLGTEHSTLEFLEVGGVGVGFVANSVVQCHYGHIMKFTISGHGKNCRKVLEWVVVFNVIG